MNRPFDATIERRLLVSYRADPEVVARQLPQGFRPQLVDGSAVVGICLIRLGHVRPHGLPRALGLRSENAAHRIAVEWDGGAGVYIPRRDSGALVNVLAGGRLFPGAHGRARFAVREGDGAFAVAFEAVDGAVAVDVRAHLAGGALRSSLFADVDSASRFFASSSVGVSPGHRGELEGVTLAASTWAVEALDLDGVRSSWFDDRRRFPAGSIELDCGLLMRDLEVTWVPSARGTAAPSCASIAA